MYNSSLLKQRFGQVGVVTQTCTWGVNSCRLNGLTKTCIAKTISKIFLFGIALETLEKINQNYM